jgi:exodeoxyribonuclease-5
MQLSAILNKSIRNFFPFSPAPQQEQVIVALLAFYCGKADFPLFVLKGYAGTGKTTLLSAFVKALFHEKKKTVLLAPTGRAAKIFSLRAEQPAYTIHKKIYRKQKVAGGGTHLVLAPNLHTNTLFLVDEASMIGDFTQQNDGSISARNLLEDLINFTYNGKNCKLVLIGDEGQLPPVGSAFSPALNVDYLSNHFPQLIINSAQLTTVLRQSLDSDILLNATALRSAPENSFPRFELHKKNDLIRLPGEELEDTLDSAFSNYGIKDTIFITRSNKRANLFNNQIRSRIFWFDEKIVSNDLLMVVRNNYFWLDDKSKTGFIANGEIIEIDKILGNESKYGFDFADARIRMIDYPDMDTINVKIMLNVLDENTPNLPRAEMKKLFFEIEKEYAFERNKKKRYERIMADPYFNALQVKYAYAVTCHKSQGGQWPCVFIDQGFLNEEMLENSYFRWLYTAFTRATEKLYLVNFHPDFFGDELDA